MVSKIIFSVVVKVVAFVFLVVIVIVVVYVVVSCQNDGSPGVLILSPFAGAGGLLF